MFFVDVILDAVPIQERDQPVGIQLVER